MGHEGDWPHRGGREGRNLSGVAYATGTML